MDERLELKLIEAMDLLERAADLLWDIDRPENNWNDKCMAWLLDLARLNNNET